MSRKSIDQAPGTSSKIDQDFIRTSTRRYIALYDLADDEYYVIKFCGFAINTVHPSDPGQLITEISAELDQAFTTCPLDNTPARKWLITLEYGPWNPLEHSVDGNPINLPARFRIDFTVAETAAFVDVDGDPIVNSAGDPYDPGLTREITRSTLYVDRNEAVVGVNLATLSAASNTLNASAWNGFPAKTVRLVPVKLPQVEYSQVTGQFFFPMQYQFDINYDTWVKQVINAGLRQLDSAGNLIPILIKGQPATQPVPLDEDGHAILNPEFLDSNGDTPDDSNSGGEDGEVPGGGEPPQGGTGTSSSSNIVINAYDLIRTIDFGFLNMDNIFTLPTI